ncbi:MAG: hypothetical protein HQM12_14790 [SAR324 cluster bacterium]|nr:hypothetical protein [SAR324 cluster bacterium]
MLRYLSLLMLILLCGCADGHDEENAEEESFIQAEKTLVVTGFLTANFYPETTRHLCFVQEKTSDPTEYEPADVRTLKEGDILMFEGTQEYMKIQSFYDAEPSCLRVFRGYGDTSPEPVQLRQSLMYVSW